MMHLFNRLKAWLLTPQPPLVIASEARQPMPPADDTHLVPFDENLLERSRTQWQFGDWANLAKLDRDTLQHHPDRAKLALLTAAGHQGLGNTAEARQHTRLAIDWGCSKKLVTQILISGVHNTLGRAAAVSGQEQRAHKHFQASIEAGAPSSAVSLLAQARVSHQLLLMAIPEKLQPIIKIKNNVVELIVNKTTVAESENKKDINKNFGTDADIDSFIEDIAPFLSSRSITYVDIGSYIGEVFLKLLSTKKIIIREAHLYEPNPESYQKLKKNIYKCSLSSLHAYNFAISNEPGEMLFTSAKSMSKHLDILFNKDVVTNTFKSDCYSLDSLSSTFTDRYIDLLKIDVEGEELDVLSSATILLKAQRINVIYIEVGLNKDATQQTYLADIDIFLQGCGYRIFKIYEQTNEWIQDSPLLRRCNVAYMSLNFAAINPYKLTLENHRLRQELKKLMQVTN
jgi:FkbM family methyltransferase